MLTFVSTGLGALALAAIPALLAVYYFRHRHRRIDVSALFLWQSVARVREGGRQLRRTPLPWLFFVELLFLALCGLAAAGPRWLRTEGRRPLVIVVDDSASMGARRGTRDWATAARRVVRDAARDRRWNEVRYILAGADVRRFDAWEPLEAAWQAVAPSADLPGALILARRLAGESGQVLVVSDHAPGADLAASDAIRWVAVGAPVRNAAIVQAVRSARDADSDYCLLGLEEFGPVARDAVLVSEWEHAPSERIALTLVPGAAVFHTLVVPRSAGIGRFRLDAPDALELDNTAVLVPSPRPQIPVALAVADEALAKPIQAALDASGLSIESPLATAALAIMDSEARPAALPPGAWGLHVRSSATARPLLGPFLRQSGHPLLEGMDLQGTAWGAASDVVLTGDPILRAGNTALVAVGSDGAGGRRVEMQWSPSRSNLQRTPDWPVFFANLLAWRWSLLPPGLESRNLRCGMPVTLALPPGVRGVECRRGQESPEALPATLDGGRGGGALVVWRPLRAGLHTVRWEGGPTLELGVNFLAPEESDLRRAASGEWGAWRSYDATSRGLMDLAWLLLLAALLVLLGHHALLR